MIDFLKEAPFPIKVFGYGRTSPLEDCLSIEQQEAMCREHFLSLRKSGALPDGAKWGHWFVDEAATGSIPWLERPQGQNLFFQLRPGDHIVIAEKDRAFRSYADACRMIEKLNQFQVRLRCLDCPVDLSTDEGVRLLQAMKSFGQLDWKYHSRRTREGIRNRREMGTAPQSRHPPLAGSVVARNDSRGWSRTSPHAVGLGTSWI